MQGYMEKYLSYFRTVLGAAAATAVFASAITPAWSGGLFPLGETTDVPRLSDKPVPYATVPERPAMPLELGCKFLGNGKLPRGVEIPGGAIWTPCLWVFGTSRTAIQTYQAVGTPGRNTEIATRLDMFVNLSLTTTEKCIVGISPLDKNEFTNFTRYSFESNQGLEGGQSEAGVYIRTAFCEGDFGSLFPNLDLAGQKLIDYGFSIGRQQITFQEGIMINDTLDAIGIVRNNLHAPGFSNIRITGVAAIDNIDRGTPANRQRLNAPYMFGLFTQADTMASTWALDFVTIQDDDTNSTGGDGYYIGLSALQRGWNPFGGIGTVNTSYRINASFGEGGDTAQVTDGVLLSAELSWTPKSSDDVFYVNPFWGIDRYSQAGREPIVGGPLAALGINFASPSLGNHLSELSSFNTQVLGVAIGYQAFWDQHRRNLVLEVAGVKDTTRNLFETDGSGTDAAGFSVQFQQAIGQRVQLQLDAFVAYLEGRDNGSGSRAEILVQF
ncbi:MAG TPA: hypothetical protein ENI69_08470 [Rhodospirillales bacterium]|nr:hypothetical protein [Rhodospirillales bacterium]